jgi:acetyltransferase-like isoleucine patch superfamily enzyme
MNISELKRRLSNLRYFVVVRDLFRPKFRHSKFDLSNFGNHAFIIKDIHGEGNKVYISEGVKIDNAVIHIRGNNNSIKFGNNCYVGQGCSFWMEGDNITIEIGANCTFTQYNHFCAQENDVSIILGNDCMISNHVIIRTSDSHPIYNEVGERINPAASVVIGNHVWIAPESKVFKGVHIGDGCIIGSNTLVTKDIEPNSLAVGVPAKVVKVNIHWTRESLF